MWNKVKVWCLLIKRVSTFLPFLIFQTIFVIDGLKRRAGSSKHEREKPGRGILTFLIIANVAMWVFKTFQIKEVL